MSANLGSSGASRIYLGSVEIARTYPPVFSGQIQDLTFADGVAINPFDASIYFSGGDVAAYSAVNLPAGIVIDQTTGIISGTTTATGRYPDAQITGTNSAGAAVSNSFVIAVEAIVSAPVFTGTVPNFNINLNIPMIPFDVRGYLNPYKPVNSYALVNAPAWLSIDGFGIITGTNQTAETVTGIQVEATNSAGSDQSNTFSITSADSLFAVSATALENGYEVLVKFDKAVDDDGIFGDPSGVKIHNCTQGIDHTVLSVVGNGTTELIYTVYEPIYENDLIETSAVGVAFSAECTA